MPFFIGYFGKNEIRYNPEMERAAHENAHESSLIKIQHPNLLLYAGFYQNENLLNENLIPLENTRGLLIGKLFGRDNYSPVQEFLMTESLQVLKDPRVLAEKYWGRYAGMLYDADTLSITLVHDPLGISSLFYMQTEHGIFFASTVALLYELAKEKPTLNISYFKEYIYSGEILFEETPFTTIFELLPGNSLHIDAHNIITKQIFWNIQTTKSSFIEDEKEFEHDLREALLKSLRAWFSDATGVCVELSGGCDSTALLLILKQVLREDQKLIAVNYMDSKDPLSNEMSYAQDVATICNVPLHFIDWSDDPLFEDELEGIRSNKPTNFFLSPSVDQKIRTIAHQNGCSHIVNGQGGDHIFLEPFLEYALADYWMQRGLKGSFSVLKDLCWYHRTPMMKLFIKNIYQFAINKFQNKLPAKIFQLQMVEHAVVFAQRNQKDSKNVMDHPFLFSPIVEMGLRIPTYQTFAQGHTRILFRRAMSYFGTPSGLWRTRKGFTSNTLIKKFSLNAPKISQLLENSILVTSGLINKRELDESLEKLRHGMLDQYDTIAKILYAQLWLKYWRL